MSDEGTHVELDELDALRKALIAVAGSIDSAADGTGAIGYDVGAFGLFASFVATTAADTARRTTAGLRAVSSNVVSDAEAVASTAIEFRTTEQTQAARFRSGERG
jgi:hypothetical protein